MDSTKLCRKCGQQKPISDFEVIRKGARILRVLCFICRKQHVSRLVALGRSGRAPRPRQPVQVGPGEAESGSLGEASTSGPGLPKALQGRLSETEAQSFKLGILFGRALAMTGMKRSHAWKLYYATLNKSQFGGNINGAS